MFRTFPAPKRRVPRGTSERWAQRARRTTQRLGWGMLLIVATYPLAGCGGGPQYDGTWFRGGEMSFRIGPAPEHWHALKSDEALIAFRDDTHRATIAVGGRCHRDGDDVPLGALTQHLFLQFTEREMIEQRQLELDGRAALETELVAQLDGVPKHFVVFVLKKDGCVYDFLRIADVGGETSSLQEFRAFVSSFRAERR